MHAETASGGTRPTLVLIPGLLCDGGVWADQIAALENDYAIVVPDLGGYSTIMAMAEAVVERLPPRFSLAGHSMGARVALQITAMVANRVERLALFDTGVHPRQTGEAARRQEMVELSASQGMTALAEQWLPPMVAEGTLRNDPALRAALFAMVERMNPEIHRRQISALLHRPDARDGLFAINCPTLVGVGAQDRWSPPEQHEEIVAAIPHARYVIFADAGHMAPMENPDAVTAALREWLATPAESEAAA